MLWKPLKIRWYEGRLESGSPKERLEIIEKLFAMGDNGRSVVDNYLVGRPVEWVKKSLGKYDYEETGPPMVEEIGA